MSGNSTNVTIPVPYSWSPSSYWDGNDGFWNTFIVEVGTPPQLFRVLPSTAGQETWILDPQGCTRNDPVDCPSRRGAFNSGFLSNESSTWQAEGIYELDEEEQALGYYGNGLYGFDTVALGNSSNNLQLKQQVVASVADKSYYLGEFGLGMKTINFTTFNNPIQNYMSNLVSKNLIPSMSFGYTAGAYYRNKASASLTLGGYDRNKFKPSNLSIAMNADNSRPLQVAITKILGVNTLSGTVNLLPTATYHFIDSTIPHIWLPSDAIQAFVTAFGLTYDNATDLYLVNDTMHRRNQQNNPTVTFVLSNTTQANTPFTQNIQLPYSAFDLQASYPFYTNATNYFPIRQAQNSSQYTIGRAFLQEAYIVADWERQNFTVGQTSFDNNAQSLVPILSTSEAAALNQTASTASSQSTQQSQSLSGGAIAGIVIGVLAAIAVIAALIFFFLRKKKKAEALSDAPEKPVHELENEGDIAELDTKHSLLHSVEIDGRAKISEKRKHVSEMAGTPTGHELGGGDGFAEERAEMPGAEPVRYELPGVSAHAAGDTPITKQEL